MKERQGGRRREKRRGEECPVPSRLGRWLDIPAPGLSCGCYLEMRGRYHLTVSGCRKILAYSPESVILGLRRGNVCVAGRRLICTAYHAGCVEIDGVIGQVTFDVALPPTSPEAENSGDGEEGAV